MKKLLFALILFIGFRTFSQETEKLPIKPWAEIVEMNSNKYQPVTKWDTDIKVELSGNYTSKDSLNIANILHNLNAITETVTIRFSKKEPSNFKIIFLDSIIYAEGGVNRQVGSRLTTESKAFSKGELYIYNTEKLETVFNSSLESRIAKALVGGNFSYPVRDKRKSIFNPIYYFNMEFPLSNEDIAVIKEVYKPSFENRLKIAEKQLKDVLDNIYKEKVRTRDRSIWWVQNPESILILPTLLLLLVFVVLLQKIYRRISHKIKNDWVLFIIVTIIGLVFVDILIVLYKYFYNFLTYPDQLQNQMSFVKTIYYTFIDVSESLILLFPFIICLRFIEIKIQKSSQIIFTKTVLIFLSTGVLPFVIIAAVMHYSGGLKFDADFVQLSRIFLYTMAIATIRALISFFIFKERNLIIENETKLSALRELKAKAELTSLQSQINPHFLYNALNSIASLAHTNADKTEKMALSLSDLFKYTINRKGKTISTVNDELEMVRSYLEIEQTRFGDRLEFVINAKYDVLTEEVPLFLIQPLVENAVKHGISKIENKGHITLNILKTEKGIEISVLDNGPDFPEGLVSGHGLQTVHDLLRLSYGDNASLQWQNAPKKQITITIDTKA